MDSGSDEDLSSLEELLAWVASQGRLEDMQLLIKEGADVNWTDPSGYPILLRTKDLPPLRLLLESGANVDITLNDGETSLFLAAASDIARVRMLLQHGANPNAATRRGDTPLVPAIVVRRPGNVKPPIVKELIAGGADVNVQNENGWAPLHWAVGSSQCEMVEILLKAGANADSMTREENTPLMAAVARPAPEDLELVGLLLQHRADVNLARPTDGEAAIHIATFCNKTEIVQLLVRAGADIDCQNSDGETPLDIAVAEGLHQMAHSLRELGGSRKRR